MKCISSKIVFCALKMSLLVHFMIDKIKKLYEKRIPAREHAHTNERTHIHSVMTAYILSKYHVLCF